MSNLNTRIGSIEDWTSRMANWTPPVKPPVQTGLPAHRMGVHWIADMVRDSDKAYMNALRPAVIKIINPSRDRVLEALQWVDSAGHVALRYHPISEQQSELAADPVGLGIKHANYWINQLNTTYSGIDHNRLAVMGINEPTIHTTEQAKGVANYTESFLTQLKPHGIRAWVFNFSVGWPREVNGVIVWDEFLYLESLINETNSFGCVHEYWYPTVMRGWNSYANRISRCPMKIRFIIGECGYTRQVAGLPQPYGWQAHMTPMEYATQLWEYHDTVDPGKVLAVCPFTTSYGGLEWANKDTLPAHSSILSLKRTFSWPSPWPSFIREEPEVSYNLVWPKMPRITQWYGPGHSGLDIGIVTGTPLYALWEGIVRWVDVDTASNGGYGLYVRINYPQLGFDSMFAHCSEVKVKAGDSVSRGQLVALSGNTGNSTGPHLHLEIRMKQADDVTDRLGVGPFGRGQVDPLAVLWAFHNLYGHEEK